LRQIPHKEWRSHREHPLQAIQAHTRIVGTLSARSLRGREAPSLRRMLRSTEDCAVHDRDRPALRLRILEMQPTQHAGTRTRQALLHEAN
jgi:hypothetical protein